VIGAVGRELDISPRLQYYAASGANSMLTRRDKLFTPSSRRKLLLGLYEP